MFWDATFLPSTAVSTRTSAISAGSLARWRMARSASRAFAEPVTFMPRPPGWGPSEEAVHHHFPVVLADASGGSAGLRVAHRAFGIRISSTRPPVHSRFFDVLRGRRD